MWIRKQNENAMLNLNLCEEIIVVPYGNDQYSIAAYQNKNKHYIGIYKTKEEADKAFRYLHGRMAWDITLIDMD